MKLAIMQPYFFPYIGYFQLINAVDKFVFYDDVNFIKLGWINRNRILVNGEIRYFTISLNGASQNKQINEIERIDNRAKLKKTILNAYCKAPNFNIAWPLIELCIDYNSDLISEIAANSVVQTSKYLGLTAEFEFSSKMYQKTNNLTKAERLIEIALKNNAKQYINPIGGIELYNKDEFKRKGIDLNFIQSAHVQYYQFNNTFISNLSIIDVMMFNSSEVINEMLTKYTLE